MGEFWYALQDPNYPFLRYALLAGALSSLCFGVIGSYVVARRITYIAAAISHSVLGGIGAAVYLRHAAGWSWCDPMYGALAAALLSALLIGLVSIAARQREDTVISAVWVVGMAVGLLLLAKTPGNIDAMSYLIGDIHYISRSDLALVAVLDLVVLGTTWLLHNKFVAVCFDEEFAELRGVQAKLYYLLLLCLVALAVLSLVRIVGNVLVIALLTLPAAVAGQLARRLWQMMALASAVCLGLIVAGLALSCTYDLLTGPTIVLLAAVVYLLVAAKGRRT